jgi:ribosomal protein S18 acetylase RimI-like enzyme
LSKTYHPIEITEKSHLRKFLNLPWEIYREDPCWVPPLRLILKRKLDPAKNPFFDYGSVKLFGVFDDRKKLAGRCAAIVNPIHNSRYNDKTGFFGMFECVDDVGAACALMGRVTLELSRCDCDRIVGPVNFTTNDESGLLVEGFDSRPVFMTNYCKPYYDSLMRGCGFNKEIDLYSYEWSLEHAYPQRFGTLVKAIRGRSEIQIRPINKTALDDELKKIETIYNDSFQDVWGFVPLTPSELTEMGRDLKLMADEDLIFFAESKGIPVGFCLSIPDLNEILQRMNGRLLPFGFVKLKVLKKRITTVRIMVLCVRAQHRSAGVAALLIDHLRELSQRKKYRNGEMAVIFESNHRMLKVLECLDFKRIKRYRIYSASITGAGKP